MIRNFKIEKPFNVPFKVKIGVNSDGLFTCTIPKDIAELFLEHGVKLHYNRRGTMGYYCSETLVGLCGRIKENIDTLCSEKGVSRKKVIKYFIETACSYAKREDGDFEPNCAYETQGLNWSSGTISTDALHREPYGIQVYAKVFEKVVYEYCNGEIRVEYHNLHKHGFLDKSMDDPIEWLASIASDSMGDFAVKEMDYTPERAWFFVNLYKSIFKINEQIKPFLTDDNLLAKAIDSKVSLLGI